MLLRTFLLSDWCLLLFMQQVSLDTHSKGAAPGMRYTVIII